MYAAIIFVVALSLLLVSATIIWMIRRHSNAKKDLACETISPPDAVGGGDDLLWKIGKNRPVIDTVRRSFLRNLLTLGVVGLVARGATEGKYLPLAEKLATKSKGVAKRSPRGIQMSKENHTDHYDNYNHSDGPHVDVPEVPHSDGSRHTDGGSPHVDTEQHVDDPGQPHIDEQHMDYSDHLDYGDEEPPPWC